MSIAEPLLRDVSDTARWIAYYRALESERPDACFRDPFARRLAGDRGAGIAAAVGPDEDNAWPFVARTVIVDELLLERVREGADLVLSLAAGLDTRPYRLDLPPSLRWVEVDLPRILDDKEAILGDARPACSLERVRLDLADVPGRRALFGRLAGSAARIVVLTEGLLSYLTDEAVTSLARDLAAIPGLSSWILELVSPGLLRVLNAGPSGTLFAAAGMPFLFGPQEGPDYFVPLGFKPVDVRTQVERAARLGRLPAHLRPLALAGQKPRPEGDSIWGAVCRLERA